MDTKERFLLFLKEKGIGQTAFEEKIGISRGSLAKKSGFGDQTMTKILNACPELNANWLLTGDGSMLREPQDSNSNSIVISNDSMVNDTNILNNSSITGSDAGLREKVKHLEAMIAEKERMILLLLRDR